MGGSGLTLQSYSKQQEKYDFPHSNCKDKPHEHIVFIWLWSEKQRWLAPASSSTLPEQMHGLQANEALGMTSRPYGLVSASHFSTAYPSTSIPCPVPEPQLHTHTRTHARTTHAHARTRHPASLSSRYRVYPIFIFFFFITYKALIYTLPLRLYECVQMFLAILDKGRFLPIKICLK